MQPFQRLRLVEERLPSCVFCWRELTLDTGIFTGELPFCADAVSCAGEFESWDGRWDEHPVFRLAA